MGQVSDSCEYGNDLSGSTQGEELSATLYIVVCSMQLPAARIA